MDYPSLDTITVNLEVAEEIAAIQEFEGRADWLPSRMPDWGYGRPRDYVATHNGSAVLITDASDFGTVVVATGSPAVSDG